MKGLRLIRAIAAAFALTIASRAGAPPPPPAPVPASLNQPVEGYDLRELYQMWRGWIESRKGPATEALLAEPEEIAGEEEASDGPILRFTKHNDFGPYLTGEIRIYCRRTATYRFVPRTCHYRLRRAFIAAEAGAYGEDNPVARWMRESFDGPRLVRFLRDTGLPSDTDWWGVRSERLFPALPSPVPMLMANATMVRLDSRDCPAMARAIRAIDAQRIDWRLDLSATGEDGRPQYPAPHAIVTVYRLAIRTPAGIATIEASGSTVARIVAPVLDAADACEQHRAN